MMTDPSLTIEDKVDLLAIAGHEIVDRLENLEAQSEMALLSAMTISEILKNVKSIITTLTNKVAELESRLPKN